MQNNNNNILITQGDVYALTQQIGNLRVQLNALEDQLHQVTANDRVRTTSAITRLLQVGDRVKITRTS